MAEPPPAPPSTNPPGPREKTRRPKNGRHSQQQQQQPQGYQGRIVTYSEHNAPRSATEYHSPPPYQPHLRHNQHFNPQPLHIEINPMFGQFPGQVQASYSQGQGGYGAPSGGRQYQNHNQYQQQSGYYSANVQEPYYHGDHEGHRFDYNNNYVQVPARRLHYLEETEAKYNHLKRENASLKVSLEDAEKKLALTEQAVKVQDGASIDSNISGGLTVGDKARLKLNIPITSQTQQIHLSHQTERRTTVPARGEGAKTRFDGGNKGDLSKRLHGQAKNIPVVNKNKDPVQQVDDGQNQMSDLISSPSPPEKSENVPSPNVPKSSQNYNRNKKSKNPKRGRGKGESFNNRGETFNGNAPSRQGSYADAGGYNGSMPCGDNRFNMNPNAPSFQVPTYPAPAESHHSFGSSDAFYQGHDRHYQPGYGYYGHPNYGPPQQAQVYEPHGYHPGPAQPDHLSEGAQAHNEVLGETSNASEGCDAPSNKSSHDTQDEPLVNTNATEHVDAPAEETSVEESSLNSPTKEPVDKSQDVEKPESAEVSPPQGLRGAPEPPVLVAKSAPASPVLNFQEVIVSTATEKDKKTESVDGTLVPGVAPAKFDWAEDSGSDEPLPSDKELRFELPVTEPTVSGNIENWVNDVAEQGTIPDAVSEVPSSVRSPVEQDDIIMVEDVTKKLDNVPEAPEKSPSQSLDVVIHQDKNKPELVEPPVDPPVPSVTESPVLAPVVAPVESEKPVADTVLVQAPEPALPTQAIAEPVSDKAEPSTPSTTIEVDIAAEFHSDPSLSTPTKKANNKKRNKNKKKGNQKLASDTEEPAKSQPDHADRSLEPVVKAQSEDKTIPSEQSETKVTKVEEPPKKQTLKSLDVTKAKPVKQVKVLTVSDIPQAVLSSWGYAGVSMNAEQKVARYKRELARDVAKKIADEKAKTAKAESPKSAEPSSAHSPTRKPSDKEAKAAKQDPSKKNFICTDTELEAFVGDRRKFHVHNLPKDITFDDFCGAIRGGPIDDMYVNGLEPKVADRKTGTAVSGMWYGLFTFYKPANARNFIKWINRDGHGLTHLEKKGARKGGDLCGFLTIKGARLEVLLRDSEQRQLLPETVKAVEELRATRVLLLKFGRNIAKGESKSDWRSPPNDGDKYWTEWSDWQKGLTPEKHSLIIEHIENRILRWARDRPIYWQSITVELDQSNKNVFYVLIKFLRITTASRFKDALLAHPDFRNHCIMMFGPDECAQRPVGFEERKEGMPTKTEVPSTNATVKHSAGTNAKAVTTQVKDGSGATKSVWTKNDSDKSKGPVPFPTDVKVDSKQTGNSLETKVNGKVENDEDGFVKVQGKKKGMTSSS